MIPRSTPAVRAAIAWREKRNGEDYVNLEDADTKPVVSEAAGTNSQSTEGEAASPSVVEAAADCKHRKSGWNPDWLKMPQSELALLTQHEMFCRMIISSATSPQILINKASGYSVMQAFEHEAVIGGFKCLSWLVKNKMAHHTNYPKLLSLAQLLGCDYFEKLKVDQRNNYQSHRIVDEMLEILALIVELPILQEIRSSQAISLEVDETTDVSVSRQLDLHVRHLDKEGCVFNHVLDLVTLEDGKADSVVAAIKSALQKKELPVDRLYGLGTDGAAVMTDMESRCQSHSGENSGGRRDPTPRNVPCSPTPRPGQPRWTWGL
ncbi:hypothetical protein KUCAC02_004190 [Chaenocephalus aceratus]|uniref:Uncharacterized protein n=1 Tax=Chaenocephalus aceratus TaxID=36190 RepID=A0ACB9WYG2_CHAAC|nr:hypothetical protein KUCAC02_004190 [Chaenocephalus aceratus]